VNTSGTVTGTNDYYPFGKRWEGSGLQAPNTRYLFSGKEEQTTGDINYMDFGSRMYDDVLGRWFTHDPQSYKRPWDSPYAYCGGNPINRVDPDGKSFLGLSTIWGSISGFLKGIFNLHGRGKTVLDKIWNGVKDVAKSTWDGFRHAVKIDWGLVKGDPNQIVSRLTWELPQTIIGNEYSHIRNIIWQVDKVRYFDGATYTIHANSSKYDGITLGSYINMNINRSYDKSIYEPNGNFTVINDVMFMHEYGHYLQSQQMGWGYLIKVGIPSLMSALLSIDIGYKLDSQNKRVTLSTHDIFGAEMDANRRAAHYFYNNYKVAWTGDDYLGYPLSFYDAMTNLILNIK
jgi:RHS repeat-associated protein